MNNLTSDETILIISLNNILINYFKNNNDLELICNFKWIFNLIDIICVSNNKNIVIYHLNLIISQLDRLKKINNIYSKDISIYQGHILLKIIIELLIKSSDKSNNLLFDVSNNKYTFFNLDIEFIYYFYFDIIKNGYIKSANIIYYLLCKANKYSDIIRLFFLNKNINYKKFKLIKPIKLIKYINSC